MSSAPKLSLLNRLEARLFEQVSIAPLVYFRIVFGAVMLWEIVRFFQHNWVARYYIHPEFHFTYFGFSWVEPWPGNLMYVHFLALAVLAVFIIIGLWYRASAALFFVGFTYVFLLEQAKYLNHLYLVCWVAFLITLVPAHRAASIDVFRRPGLRVETVPAWTLWLLRAMVGIAYFFGGVAKINGDWLRAEPIRTWVHERADTFPLIGPFFDHPFAGWFFAYTGLLFDLFIVPLLLWRRTRVFAVALVLIFHMTNFQLFSIGIFPWLMLFATPIFFDPRSLRPLLGVERFFGDRSPLDTVQTENALINSQRQRRWVLVFLTMFAAFHIFMPLRHHLYPGNVNWTEEGHKFSWHMKLRDKGGKLELFATDLKTGETWKIDQRKYLTRRQRRKMRGRPEMIVQFCRYVEARYRTKGHEDVKITARCNISLNGRPPQLLIDPGVDLTTARCTLKPTPWILPLETPLPPRRDYRKDAKGESP